MTTDARDDQTAESALNGADDRTAGAAASRGELSEALVSRHAGTLGGRLADLGASLARPVEIAVSSASARTRAGQHLAVHLANLLGRLEGVVSTLSVRVESDAARRGGDVPLLTGIDPRRPDGGGSLVEAVRGSAVLAARHRLAEPAGAVDSAAERQAFRVRVGAAVPGAPGADSDADADVYVAAGEWTAFVGRRPGPECAAAAETGGDFGGAVGAHVAAAFASAEVFRALRDLGPRAGGPDGFTFSAWSWREVGGLAEGDAVAAAEGAGARGTAGLTVPDLVLVGVGAVGSAFLLTLWASGAATPWLVAVDGDAVSLTNLNRYPLFALADRGAPKGSRAAALLARGGASPFGVTPVDAWWGDYLRTTAPGPLRLVVSAVDTNVARGQIQDALPRLIFGASTLDLRAEVGRYELRDPRSRCLRCFNPPESGESDTALRRRLLAMDDAALAREAEDRGVAASEVAAFVADVRAGGTGCAFLAGPALERLRRAEGESGFAVSFVSGLAGSLLAAQVLREAAGAAPALAPPATRAIFQLWSPDVSSNEVRAAPVDAACECQTAGYREAFTATWRE